MSEKIDIGIYISLCRLHYITRCLLTFSHFSHVFLGLCFRKQNTVPENGKQNDSREKTSFFVSRAKQRKWNGVARNDVAEERRRTVWEGFFERTRRITRDLQKKNAASKSVGVPKKKNCESFLCVFLPQFSLILIVCVNVFICGVLSVTFVAFLKSRIKIHYPHHSPHSRIQSIQSWPTMGLSEVSGRHMTAQMTLNIM